MADGLDKKTQIGLEEWRLLQAIIARHEGLEYQTRGWLLVLLGILVAALFAKESLLSLGNFRLSAAASILIFMFLELLIRVPKRKAIGRVRYLENKLSENNIDYYEGPRISETLTKSYSGENWFSEIRNEFCLPIVFPFYVFLVILMGLVSWDVPASRSDPDANLRTVHSMGASHFQKQAECWVSGKSPYKLGHEFFTLTVVNTKHYCSFSR